MAPTPIIEEHCYTNGRFGIRMFVHVIRVTGNDVLCDVLHTINDHQFTFDAHVTHNLDYFAMNHVKEMEPNLYLQQLNMARQVIQDTKSDALILCHASDKR